MNELLKKVNELLENVMDSWRTADIDSKILEEAALTKQLSDPGIWQDNIKAQDLTKRHARIEAAITPWQNLRSKLEELQELAEMNDSEMLDEISTQLDEADEKYETLKKESQYSGPYDDHDAILRLSAGAGGTDAQDWTEMLLRMYTRWSEKSKMKSELLEQSAGEEAGLKSAVLSISGTNAYGRLRSEHGVHRLVRLSPFNSDNLRQTSFALVEVLPQIDAPDEVEIDDKDLKIDVYRAGGHGGQSVNTTDSAVRVTHIPTGIVVAIQNERSQLQNKETAMKVLRSKLAQLQIEQHQEDLANLKGPTKSAEWGAQIRNYVIHPYKQVKDTRTKYEESDAEAVLDGKIDGFIESFLAKPKT